MKFKYSYKGVLLMQYIGINFMDMQYNNLTVESFSEHYNRYMVKQDNLIGHQLMTDQEIEFYLSKQEKLTRLKKESEERERIEQEEQERLEQQYNNTYGYTDNLTPMQKGKVLKILNTEENYYSNGVEIGRMTRKDFIKSILDNGGKVEHKKDIKYYARNYELKIKKNEYRLVLQDNTFYEITKTEYDYGLYLINTYTLT